MAAASGLYNLTRQLGGSIGVALLTMLLDKRGAFHHAVLSEKMGASDPATLERVETIARAMMARGSDAIEAHGRALTILAGSVKKQAAILAFADTFWATAVLIVCTLPLVLLLGKPAKGAKPVADH